jgi:DNA-binding SARP family transcriptional activator
VPVGGAPLDCQRLEAAAPKVLSLFDGPFLAGDAESPWQIAMRDRLTGRFQRFAQRLGAHWESAGQWARAGHLYQRVVELDPLAESFYRRQMVCLDALGQRAEALDVYRRCRQMLSITLGVAPSQETDAIDRGGRVPSRGVGPQPGQAETRGTQRATADSRVGTVSLSVCRPSSCM